MDRNATEDLMICAALGASRHTGRGVQISGTHATPVTSDHHATVELNEGFSEPGAAARP